MKLSHLLLFLFIPLAIFAEDFDYIPKIHGTFRGKYELETEDGVSRFQVRNARMSVEGNILPIIDYKIQFDVCEKGKMRFLDAWCRMKMSESFKIQVGQFRKPFGVDAFRAPADQFFANRSFIAKQVGNVRGVGLKLVYLPKSLPLTLEGGVFNSKSVDNQESFSSGVSVAFRALYKIGNVTVVGGCQTMKPSVTRIELYDATVNWTYDRWFIEGEYMYKHYSEMLHPECHAYNAQVQYKMPIKLGVFNQASFQARFDGMTDHSNGIDTDGEGYLAVSDVARNRATIGTTITYKYKSIHADIRLNYEKYFYHSDFTPTEGNRDKVVAELVVKF